MLIVILSAFLVGAVVCDLVNHRLPNYFLLLGFMVGLIGQGLIGEVSGVAGGFLGGGAGLALFIPIYACGGMAAGDVKLMAVVGAFLGVPDVLWAGALSLIAGGLLGVSYLICRGEFWRFLERYWAMASLRSYIPAEEQDAACHRFPYAIAIAAGTMLSLYWTPI